MKDDLKTAGWSQSDQNADESPLRRESLTAARAFIARRKAEELYSSAPPSPPTFTPSILMHELRIGRNLAASILEELERAGELVLVIGQRSIWHPAPPAQPVGRGYALPLSQKEASALLRLLDWTGQAAAAGDLPPSFNMVLAPGGATILREIRRRLKGGPL